MCLLEVGKPAGTVSRCGRAASPAFGPEASKALNGISEQVKKP